MGAFLRNHEGHRPTTCSSAVVLDVVWGPDISPKLQ